MLLPPTGNPGEQEWQVTGLENGNCAIRNLSGGTYGTYLGFEGGEPAPNMLIGGFPDPCEWVLCRSSAPSTFHIVAPGGPIGGGTELAVDLSLLRIFPPRIALRPLDVNNSHQAWAFRFHE